MSLFNANIADKIYQGFKGKLLEGVLTREQTLYYDPITDEVVTETSEHPFEGVVEDYNQRLVADGVVQANDRKVLVLAKSLDVTPSSGGNENDPDEITIDGHTFSVVSVKSDPATATYTVQGRI